MLALETVFLAAPKTIEHFQTLIQLFTPHLGVALVTKIRKFNRVRSQPYSQDEPSLGEMIESDGFFFKLQGLRRLMGVTIVPTLMVLVFSIAAVNRIQGSAKGNLR